MSKKIPFLMLGLVSFAVASDRVVTIEPPTEAFKVNFDGHNMFVVEADDFRTTLSARHIVSNDDSAKKSTQKYMARFTYGDTSYLLNSLVDKSYEAGKNFTYERPDGSKFTETVDPQPVLDQATCQKAFEEGNLKEYFAEKGWVMFPANDRSGQEMLMKLAGIQAFTGNELGALGTALEAQSLESAASSSSEQSTTYRASFGCQGLEIKSNTSSWRIHVRGSTRLEKFNRRKKQLEYMSLYVFQPTGSVPHVFYGEGISEYKFEEFKTTTEPGENPGEVWEVSTPVFHQSIYGGKTFDFPEDATRILRRYTSEDVQTDTGFLCVREDRRTNQHTLRMVTQTTTTLGGYRVLPDGSHEPFTETQIGYRLMPNSSVTTTECGKWYICAGVSDDMTELSPELSKRVYEKR